MTVIRPHHRAKIARSGTGTRGHVLLVHVRGFRRYGAASALRFGRPVVGERPFIGLGVEHAMRMDRIRPRCLVVKDHADLVADLSVNDRPQDAEVLPRCRSRLALLEGRVGLFDENRFLVF